MDVEYDKWDSLKTEKPPLAKGSSLAAGRTHACSCVAILASTPWCVQLGVNNTISILSYLSFIHFSYLDNIPLKFSTV